MSKIFRAVAVVLLLGWCVASGAPAPAATASDVVYFVGDSITAGIGVGAGNEWRDAYPSRAGAMLCGFGCDQAHVIGHGGQCLVATVCGYGPTLLSTFGPEVLQADPRPTEVMVEIGVNDLAHVTDTQLEHAYLQLVQQGQAAGIRVVLSTITPTTARLSWHATVEAQRLRVNDWLRAHIPAGQLADFAAALQNGNNDLWDFYDCGDGLHPNRWGAQVMADVTLEVTL